MNVYFRIVTMNTVIQGIRESNEYNVEQCIFLTTEDDCRVVMVIGQELEFTLFFQLFGI